MKIRLVTIPAAVLIAVLGSGSAASAASVSTANSSRPTGPAVQVCGAGPSLVRPASMILACADDGELATHLAWSSWTSARATATGIVTWRACTSRCADSTRWERASADVTLADPVAQPGKGVLFTRLELRVTGPTPAGFLREVSFSEAPLTAAPALPAGTPPRREAISAPSGSLGYAQIEGFWDDAGGPSGSVSVPGAGVYTQDQIAAAITGAEASFLPGIIQGGVDYCGPGADRAGWGLWQITCGNSVPQFGTDFQLLDPWNNAEAAVAKYDAAGGFAPWTTYLTGAYLQYLQHTSADTQLTDPGEYVQINPTPSGTPASPPPAPGSTYGPPMPGGGTGSLTDLFVYNRGSGASYAELANGAGGWNGVAGPRFAPGWDFYPGNLDGDGWTDMFLYNPSTGASWAEFGNGAGGWTRGVKGPQFAAGWAVYTGNFNHDNLTDLFVYNKTSGASYVELANGHGGWTGVAGPRFAPGWDFYPATLNSDAYTDMFLYKPTTGASWAEFSDGAGHWTGGVKGPQFAPGWNIYPAALNSDAWTDLFLYNPSTGASWVEFANGAGSWVHGVKGPQFSTGWTVYTGQLG
jgi:hypothetical protein